jgi:hypothetical protein
MSSMFVKELTSHLDMSELKHDASANIPFILEMLELKLDAR